MQPQGDSRRGRGRTPGCPGLPRGPRTDPETLFAGDLDHDRDVDLADYLAIVKCVGGPGVSIERHCDLADLDRDGDVDLADVIQVQTLLIGAR